MTEASIPAPERTAGRQRVWFGGYTSPVGGQPGGPGLVTATIDPADGTPCVIGGSGGAGGIADLADPSYLAWSPDGSVLYACGETAPEGYAGAYRIGGDGTPVLFSRRSVEAAGPTHISVHPAGRHVFTANYVSGSVTVLPIGPDGSLGEATDVVRHDGKGPNPDRQEGPHAHQVVPDATGAWLIAVDLGTDTLYVYRFDAAAGKLTPHQQLVMTPGSGPRHLAFHPGQRHAYLADELASTITVLGWDAERGLLDVRHVLPALPYPATALNQPGEVVVGHDARFVYLTNRGDDSVSTFAVSEDGAMLTAAGATPVGGTSPRDLRLDPTGRRLYAANQFSNAVSWLDLDPVSGLPTLVGTISAPAVSSILFAPER